ncbi:MAG: OmpH family outer membrane protein [Psittacicella sp.]
MKKTTKIAVLAGLVSAFGIVPAMAATNSIAYVNVPYLFQNHPLRVQLVAQINKVMQPQINSLKTQQATINADVQALTTGISNKTLTKSQITVQENTITELKQAYSKNYMASQKEAQQLQATARDRIMKSITTASQAVALKDGYTYVFPQEALVYGPTNANITTQVLAQIKINYKAAQQNSMSNSNMNSNM